MRTLILALTVLLFAAPVWATVTITTEKDATNPQKVWIGYTSTETEPIRAFALDITADHNIVEVNDYAVGDDNGGFGIFPGTFAASITVNPTTGMVDNWDVAGYSPVAPAGDPGALGGIGTTGATIEMGSLYDQAAAPANSGILCSVTMEADTTGNLCVTANAIRGKVVLESAAEAQDLVLPDGTVTACGTYGGGPCFPSSFGTYADWVSYGKPLCWCHSTKDPLGTGDYQCEGDADGKTEGALKYRVFTKDLGPMVASWKQKIATADPCADFDHKAEGALKYRVFTKDLGILVANWKKKDAALSGDCGLETRPE